MLALNDTPVKDASVVELAVAVPCSDVIAKPETITVSFGILLFPDLQ